MKKIISLVLVLMLIFALSPMAYADGGEKDIDKLKGLSYENIFLLVHEWVFEE